MQIKLTAKATTLNGHTFDRRKDYKTACAMLKSALGLV